VDEHPYSSDPSGAIGHRFMLIHLQESYNFWCEMMQSQPTCHGEVDIFHKFGENRDRMNGYYGKAVCFGAYVPFVLACGMYRGFAWKCALFYVLFRSLNPLYDCGVYLRFLVNGPGHFKRMIELDPKTSFNSI